MTSRSSLLLELRWWRFQVSSAPFKGGVPQPALAGELRSLAVCSCPFGSECYVAILSGTLSNRH